MSYLKKTTISVAIIVLFLAVWQVGNFFVSRSGFSEEKAPEIAASEKVEKTEAEEKNPTRENVAVSNESGFMAPVDLAEKRITKKTFGLYVTPETSPVQPDKFRGFHAGVDWEVFSSELDRDVPVKAVCSGPLQLKKTASGYGGVAVQRCDLENEPITVIYGHMKLSSIQKKVGEFFSAGEVVGLLGDDKSVETDGARKHLHLGFHRTDKIDIKGYLPVKQELEKWIDPCLYVCK